MEIEDKKLAIESKANEIISIAEKLFEIEMKPFQFRYYHIPENVIASTAITYAGPYIRFNLNYLVFDGHTWDYILNKVVAHEIAHQVCFLRPDLGKHHNYGWKKVCKALGGNGKTKTFNSDIPEYGVQYYPFLYDLGNGPDIFLTEEQHDKIQNHGLVLYQNYTLCKIDKNCSFTKTTIEKIIGE